MATGELARQQLLIGGSWTDAAAGKTFEQVFPYTGDAVGVAAAAGREDARAAADAAHSAFADWSHSSPGSRREILLKAADLLLERQQDIARLVTEVIPSDVPGKLAMGVRQPAGVVLAIAPWNAPVILSYAEESFGPLVTVIEVNGDDEAVAVANDTPYGLSAAIFSEDVPAALELAGRIESGICHINDTTVQDEPQMPFGGVKARGFGRFGARTALDEFTELRWITVQQLPRQYPI
jgi:acyl-CoA reductase-like NAD-dependent aldehyde dehydrogenase